MQGPKAPEDPRQRRLATWFSAALLLFQVAVPLRYYLGQHDSDERFSWRMFSSVRLRDCRISVQETLRDHGAAQLRPVAVERDVQVAWVRLLERMRGSVVDKYLERRCQEPQVGQVEYTGNCNDTDGTALPPLRRALKCASGATAQEVTP